MCFVFQVHSLEKANKKLELQIKEFYDNKRPMQSKDLSAYYKTISELRAQVKPLSFIGKITPMK